MREGSAGITQWRSTADIFGWLSLLCGFPLLTMALARGRLHFPDSMAPMILWMIFRSPFAGSLLALIAATGRRWWLVPAAVWLAVLSYGWWDLSRHPFVI
jgi:hypothetical protein